MKERHKRGRAQYNELLSHTKRRGGWSEKIKAKSTQKRKQGWGTRATRESPKGKKKENR